MASRNPPTQQEGALRRIKERTLSSWVSSILAGVAPPAAGARLSAPGSMSFRGLGTPAMAMSQARPRTPSAPASWTARPLGSAPAWRARAPTASRADRLSRVGRLIEQSRASAHRQVQATPANQSGVALMELMLVVGTIMVVTGGVFAVYRVAENSERVARETQNAEEIAQNLGTVMASTANFNNIDSTAKAVEMGIIPDRMIDGNGAVSSWGGTVSLEPYTIGGATGRGVLLTYEGVPSSACSRFISNVGPGFHTIKVNDAVLSQNFSTLSAAAIANLCSAASQNKVELVYIKDGGTGLAVAPVASCVPAAPETQTITTCPPGQLGEQVQKRDFVCLSPYGPSTPTPWSTISSTCAPICVAPPPSVSTTPLTNTASCAAGRVTSSGSSTFTRTRTRTNTITYYCPAPTGPHAANPVAYTYTPWTPTEAIACAAQCTAPASTTAPITRAAPDETRNIACPAGQLGSTAQKRTQVENGISTTSWTCPAPTGAATSSSTDSWLGTYTATGAWTTVSSTCAPQCVAPPTTNSSQTRPATCASGRLTPSGSDTFEQTRSVSVSYSCPAPTGPATANPATYGAWGPLESAACAPVCQAPPDTTQPNSQTATCPAGTFVLGPTTAVVNFTQTQQRSVSYSCPSPTGGYTTSYGAWSTLSPTVAATCATKCTAPDTLVTYTPQSRSVNCPAGSLTVGGATSFTQNRTRTNTTTYSCPAYAGAYTTNPTTYTYTAYGPSVAATCFSVCTAPPPSTETAPAPTQYRTLDCPATQYGKIDQSRWVTHSRTVTNTCPAPTGNYTTSYGEWGAPYTYGTYQTDSSTCASCPPSAVETEKQWAAPFTLNDCPADYHGYRSYEHEQERTRTRSYNCPAGTRTLPPASYTAWSAWANTGAQRRTSSSCTACPAPATETQNRWAGTTFGINNCPAGNYGHNNYEYYQVSTRTKSYNCPAGTSTLPAASYTAWSAWANTTTYRYTGSSCVSCPPPAIDTDTRWVAYQADCPASQYGVNNRSREQIRTRTISHNCPAGTTSLPPASYTTWSAYSNTGTTRLDSSTCANCPAPVTETDGQWVAFNHYVCAAGMYGSDLYERYQTRTRTKSYSCPAGTRTLPAASYTAWSAWANTTTYRYTGSSCVNCPAPATDTQSDWEARSQACPAGWTGSHTWEEIRQRSRSKSYSCPANTASLPTPTYGAYGSWSWTGTRRNEVNTCTPPASAPCAGGGTVTWSSWSNTCSGRIPAGTHASGAQVYVFAIPIKYWDGSAGFTCNNGTWVYNGDGFCMEAGM